MSKKLIILLTFFISAVGFFLDLTPVKADEPFGQCFCKSYDNKSTPETIEEVEAFDAFCNPAYDDASCPREGGVICEFYPPALFGVGTDAEQIKQREAAAIKQCNENVNTALKLKADTILKIQASHSFYDGAAITSKFIPECFLSGGIDGDKGTQCRDTNIYIIIGINIAKYLFGIIGAVALLMFVYGGIMLIISGGSQERVKKGTDAMLAAVIGIVIVFSAYLLVGFITEAVGVSPTHNLF